MTPISIGTDVLLQDDIGTVRAFRGEDALVVSASSGELLRVPVNDLRAAEETTAAEDPNSHGVSLWLLGHAPQRIFGELVASYDEDTARSAMEYLNAFVFEATQDRPYDVGEKVRTVVDGRRVFGEVVAYAPEESLHVEWDLPNGRVSTGRIKTADLDRKFTLLIRAYNRICRVAEIVRQSQDGGDAPDYSKPPPRGQGTPEDPAIVPKISPKRRPSEKDMGLSKKDYPHVEQIPQALGDLEDIGRRMMTAFERYTQLKDDLDAANQLVAATEEAALAVQTRADKAVADNEVKTLAREYAQAIEQLGHLTGETTGMDFRRFEMALRAAEGETRQVVTAINKRIRSQSADPAREKYLIEVLGRVKEEVGPIMEMVDEGVYLFETAMEELQTKMIAELAQQIHETVVAQFPATEHYETTTRTRTDTGPEAPAEEGVPATSQYTGGVVDQARGMLSQLWEGVQNFGRNLFGGKEQLDAAADSLEQYRGSLREIYDAVGSVVDGI